MTNLYHTDLNLAKYVNDPNKLILWTTYSEMKDMGVEVGAEYYIQGKRETAEFTYITKYTLFSEPTVPLPMFPDIPLVYYWEFKCSQYPNVEFRIYNNV